MTGVLCKELTRQEIWNALLARRCYAATSTRILLDVTLNGLTMGRDFRLTKKNKNRFAERTIRIRAVGVRPLTRVVIVRNGQEVFEQALDQTECDLVWQDTERLGKIHDRHIRGAYYYAKVYQQDGNLAWSSPVWLSFTP